MTTSQNPRPSSKQPKDNVFATAGVGQLKESAILLGILTRHDNRRELTNPLEELEQLAGTANIQVFDHVIQKLDRPNAATYCGSGTAKKVADLAKEHGVDTIICDNDLSPAQLRNLEKICEWEIRNCA